jgi:RNA recognition motif-containing protein
VPRDLSAVASAATTEVRERREAAWPVRGDPAISNKVFVGNLSFDVTRDELIAAFSAAGKVVDAKLPTDRETGRPRGFAFVEFEDDDTAQKSIALMNGKDLKGRPLRVNEAENRPPRAPGAGGGPFRPGLRGGPPPGGFSDFTPMDDRGRPFKSKGSRRNIRRRKRGFD